MDDKRASVFMRRSASSTITFVDDAVWEMLGWRPDQLVGKPSTAFIHPADQGGAVQAWMAMVHEAGSTGIWRGRYRTASGGWQWVETINTNHLDQPEPAVHTRLYAVTPDTGDQADAARAREELLHELSDALPVGLMLVDLSGTVGFTNERLRTMLGCDEAATVESLFGHLSQRDLAHVRQALTKVLASEPVDDFELAICSTRAETRYLSLHLGPLTNTVGDVTGAVGCLSDVTAAVHRRQQLERKATTDELTACLNRAAIVDELNAALSTMRRGFGVAVVYVDLDGFKATNDEHGHAAGDLVLVEAARLMEDVVRSGDRVGRMGGDEFLVVLCDVAGTRQARLLAERIELALCVDLTIGDVRVRCRASTGVAFTDRVETAQQIIAQADAAMYANKRYRKDREVAAVALQ